MLQVVEGALDDDVTVEFRSAPDRYTVTQISKDSSGNVLHAWEGSFAGANDLVFHAFGGDDEFDNMTSIDSIAHGGPGEDYFKGGSGNDEFYYVIVDQGAIKNANEGSTAFFAGIGDAFEWRFQTDADDGQGGS